MGHLLHAAGAQGEAGAAPGLRAGPLRRLDPRGRLLAAVGFAVVVSGLEALPVLGLALACALGALALSGLPPGRTLRRMAMMDGFVVAMLLTLPLTTPGTPALILPGGWVATHEGLRLTLVIALRANAAILMLMALAGTMEPVTLGHALARLGVPLRLVHLALFTIRYIEVLRAEYLRMRLAMRARAFRPGTNRHSWVSLGHLVGMMLVRAMERAERVMQAMKCRGFTGQLPLLDDLAWGAADRRFGVAVALGLMGLILLEVLHVRAA